MEQVKIHEHAQLLWDTHGSKAIAVAAQKARDLEQRGEKEEAANWRRIEAALLVKRGPHQS